MTDYISREMTIDAICRLCNANFEEDPCEPSECEMMSLLREIPAADVRPVVLCRDCKWYQIDELKKDGTEDRRYKPSVCVLAEQRRDPNHFCADGKKREES